MFVYLIGSHLGYCKIGVCQDAPAFRMIAIDKPKLPFELILMAEYNLETKTDTLYPRSSLIDAHIAAISKTQSKAAAHFVETQLQKYFNCSHVRGEWFKDVSPSQFLKAAKRFHKEYKGEL